MLGKRRNPYLAVDAVIVYPEKRKIVLIKRKKEPFRDFWALPGGFVEWGETVENACKREVKEETSLDVEIIDLVGVFSNPKRDPRGHVVSIAFLCIPKRGKPIASSDAKYVDLINIDDVCKAKIKLAFDHYDIILQGVKKAKEKGLL